MKLTDAQREMLAVLDQGPRTTREIVDASWVRTGAAQLTFDRAHSSLRRLEDRELVRRVLSGPTKWELTSAGRKALNV